MTTANGYDLVLRTAIDALRPDPELMVDEWAEEFVVLPKSGPQPGPFRFERSYPARRVHQVLSPSHPCKRVVARVASQMFKTQTALNWIGAIIHRRPRNILALQPTDTLVKRFSARVSTMVRNMPVLRERVSAHRSRDARNTVQAKDFLGDATLYMNTAGSAANLAEVSAPYIYFDEIDRADRDVDGEGGPVELGEARATQYDNECKFFYTSSPSLEGFSKIDELFEKGTQESYHVPCPHCGHLHELVLDSFHYQRDPDTGFMDRAWFTCPECGCDIEEQHKARMLPDVEAGGQARWVATASGDGETISFTLSAFYMPVGAITWLSLARQLAHAREALKRGDHGPMQVFWNTRLGLSYRNAETVTTAQQLRARAKRYPPRVVPDAALVATMSVDTQGNRLEAQIEAWGPGMQHWVLDYIVLPGSPAEMPDNQDSVWQRLDDIRRTPLMHVSGCPIYISAYGIDAGGNHTQDVYNYGAARVRQSCVVLGGATRPNRPIISSVPSRVDIDWQGQKVSGGVERWTVGTDVAKDWLLNRLLLPDGPGAMHYHEELPAEWFDQMVAESPRTRWVKGRAIREWIKPNGARNEAWDLSVYNLAIAYKLGLHKWSALDWRRLRDKLIPQTGFLFSPPPVDPAAPPASVSVETQAVHVNGDDPSVDHPLRTSASLGASTIPSAPAVPGPAVSPTPAWPQNAQPVGRRILSKGIRP